jgi:hypothetical protein
MFLRNVGCNSTDYGIQNTIKQLDHIINYKLLLLVFNDRPVRSKPPGFRILDIGGKRSVVG